MKISIIILKFLILGALFIVSNQNLYINDSHDRAQFYGSFFSWLETLFEHSKQISGYVIDSEWVPEGNLTNSSQPGGG